MDKLPIICMMTDFGIADSYVGEMKGVALGICPNCRFVDLTHKIRKFDIEQACYVLARSHSYFPEKTIFVAVVDPGVGSARRSLVVQNSGHYFVGPDNGIFSFLIRSAAAIFHQIKEKKYILESISSTFHGRDIFSPVAAHLAMGVEISELGPRIDDPILLPNIWPEKGKGLMKGKVIHIDNFGNLITNITLLDILQSCVTENVEITLGEDKNIKGIHKCFEDVEKGEPLALWGSGNFLEIAVREGKADRVLNSDIGTPVHIKSK